MGQATSSYGNKTMTNIGYRISVIEIAQSIITEINICSFEVNRLCWCTWREQWNIHSNSVMVQLNFRHCVTRLSLTSAIQIWCVDRMPWTIFRQVSIRYDANAWIIKETEMSLPIAYWIRITQISGREANVSTSRGSINWCHAVLSH